MRNLIFSEPWATYGSQISLNNALLNRAVIFTQKKGLVYNSYLAAVAIWCKVISLKEQANIYSELPLLKKVLQSIDTFLG